MNDQPWISPYSGGATFSTFGTVGNATSFTLAPTGEANWFTLKASSQTLMTLHNAWLKPPADTPIITIYKPDSSPQQDLAKILRNGTVVLSYPGAEEEAAKVFWRALEFCGVSYVKRIRELEDRLAKYETVDRFVP